MDTNQLALLFAAVSAFAALGAAAGAWRSARATQRAAEANLLLRLLEEYASQRMLDDLRLLRNWKAQHGNVFAVRWKAALDQGDSEAVTVDLARRHVSSFFHNPLILHKRGFVGGEFLRTVAGLDGINVLFDVVEALEYALNPRYATEGFTQLRVIAGRPGTGALMAPVGLPDSSA